MTATDCPWSMTTEVGETVTDSGVSTDTVALVAGVAVIVGVEPPVVPVSVTVRVSTQSAVVPVGAYGSVTAPEFAKPGQLPDFTDQA